jgi:DNA-binding NarL/FixJ family response regulator
MREGSPGTISVYLLDVHPVVRERFARAIAADRGLEVVGQARRAAAALEETALFEPDVILVDLDLAEHCGVNLVGLLRAQLPRARVLIVTSYDDEIRLTDALREGACGYLIETAGREEIVEAIRWASAGGAPLSVSIAAAVMRGVPRGKKRSPPPAGATIPALRPGPPPPSLTAAVDEPDEEASTSSLRGEKGE